MSRRRLPLFLLKPIPRESLRFGSSISGGMRRLFLAGSAPGRRESSTSPSQEGLCTLQEVKCSFMWWVLPGAVAGLAGSSLWIVLWFSRLRLALAERGWKYTSLVVALLPIAVLPTSVHMLLGGTVESTVQYAFAALSWIVLATMVAGIMLDAVRRMRHFSVS